MIRIPTTRLSERVVLRILGLQKQFQAPQTAALGATIDQSTETPTQPVAAPDGLDQAIIAKALNL